MSLYEVLGVAPDASTREIRQAYLHLARIHHPDFHGAEGGEERRRAEAKMRELNEAWVVLGDPRARREHDRALVSRQLETWSPGEATPGFVPFDPGDDPDDPAAAHDIAYGDGSAPPRSMQMAPVVLAALSLVALAVGAMVGIAPLVRVGVVMAVVAAVSFLAAPMFALLRSERQSRPGR